MRLTSLVLHVTIHPSLLVTTHDLDIDCMEEC